VPSHYADLGVVIGGEIQKETYSEFQNEMDMFNQAFIEIMSEGDAKGRVFTFPIPTYNITKDFDWDNPVIEFLWEMAGNRKARSPNLLKINERLLFMATRYIWWFLRLQN